MFREYDVVRLKRDRPAEGLTTDQIGAIVMVYPATPPAYEVEFVDRDGKTVGLLTLQEEEIELVERPTQSQHISHRGTA